VALRPRRIFWISAALSLALHVIVLSGLPSLTVTPETVTPPLRAQFLRIEPPAAPAAPPAPEKAAPQPASTAQAPRAARPATLPTPAIREPSESPVAAPAALPAAEETAAATEAEPAPEPQAPPAVAQAAPQVDTPPVSEPAANPGVTEQALLPASGEITYELFFGTDKFSIGRSVQTWSIDESTYRLTSFSETTGLARIIKPYQYAYVSEGRVEAGDLRPDSFSVRRGREGERQATAKFDWVRGELTLGPIATPRTVQLQNGTHDLLSFIYQLARKPITPGRMQFALTTGTKVETFVIEVGADEQLDLPLGLVRAIPVKQIGAPGEERMELWLAYEAPRLPLLIRFFDRAGKISVEQLANKISTHGT